MLHTLSNYSRKWGLQVNVHETKSVVFRNRGLVKTSEKWMYENQNIDIVNEFTYLGILLKFNGKFLQTQKQLALQGNKALFAMRSNVSQLMLNHCTLISLFDTYVLSILNYSCEIWGNHKGAELEKIHLNFLKNILGVKKTTSNCLTYFECGRLPLRIIRIIRVFKFWFRLLCTDSCILKHSYQWFVDHVNETNARYTNWANFIKIQLCELGLSELWYNQENLTFKIHFPLIKQRIIDNCVQSFYSEMTNSPKCFLYKNIVDNFTLQFYLCKPIPVTLKRMLSKIRLSSHQLLIESGRHYNIPRNERMCPLCRMELEDEYHFILKCSFYSELRSRFIKKYYWKRPSFFKFVQLLSTNNVKDLSNLGKFIKHGFDLRCNLI